MSIGVPQAASLSNLPLLLARELGFFKAEGIVLDWVPLASEAAAAQALAKGRISLLSCDFAHTLMHGVRALALERRLTETNTVHRIRRLQGLGVFDKAMGEQLADAFNFMLGLRLATRLEKMRLHQPLDNFIRPDGIGKLERDLLKDSLQIVKQLKEVVRHHFHLAMF